MKIFIATALLAGSILAAPIVTYTVTGDFNPGSTAATCDATLTHTCQTTGSGGGTLSYLMGGGNVDLGVLNPSNITFGTIFSFGNVGSLTLPGPGRTFTMTVHQTTPTAGSDTTVGKVSGTVVANASNAFLFFADPVLNIGNVTYTVFQTARGIPIVPPSTDALGTTHPGSTTIQGSVSATAVPEPTTMALMGMGLIGLGLVARRRIA